MFRRFLAVAVLVAACDGAPVSSPTSEEIAPAELPACLSSDLMGKSKDDVIDCAGAPCIASIAEGTDTERWRYCAGSCRSDCAAERYVFFNNGVVTGMSR